MCSGVYHHRGIQIIEGSPVSHYRLAAVFLLRRCADNQDTAAKLVDGWLGSYPGTNGSTSYQVVTTRVAEVR